MRDLNSSDAQRGIHIERFTWRFAPRDHLTSGRDPRRVMQRLCPWNFTRHRTPRLVLSTIFGPTLTVSKQIYGRWSWRSGHHWGHGLLPANGIMRQIAI